ncbi:threonine/serine exporter family protein [Nakamurella antarctica]|uniref:Threonine/serine exporter family protein n=1 Tax=Nakamurella antarctica TaxID=1902245 RepID=A0A3G8ZM66_9ACTN|nr:threonine/serine exporter family protein [Nakamurella antarctica]AZI58258.1 threonine/serine exporter family protein [Nakamurella antarctica]
MSRTEATADDPKSHSARTPSLRRRAGNADARARRAIKSTSGKTAASVALPARNTLTSAVKKTDLHQATRAQTLRDRARRVVADLEPPVELSPAVRQSGLSLETEKDVLDLALRIGESMVSTGASVASSTTAMLRVGRAYGVTSLFVDITFTSISATIEREDAPITRIRVVALRSPDYSRLAALGKLVSDAGVLPLPNALARLDSILAQSHPYRRGVVTIALGAMAAGVAILVGGGIFAALVAFGTTVMIDRTLRWMRNRGLPYLFQQALGAAIATGVALVLIRGKEYFSWGQLVPPSVVVASGIVVLLAGLSTVGAAEDAIAGFPLTAAARTFEVVLYTAGIVIGVGIVLDFGGRIGIPLNIIVLGTPEPPWFLQMVAGAVISAGWAVASYSLPRTILVATGVGALAAGAAKLMLSLGFGGITSSFIAALFVGFLAYALSEKLGVLPVVVTICGITPLLPGLAIYRAMFTAVESNNVLEGASLLVGAAGIGLALAAGVTLGQFLAAPIEGEMGRWQRRISRRGRGSRA